MNSIFSLFVFFSLASVQTSFAQLDDERTYMEDDFKGGSSYALTKIKGKEQVRLTFSGDMAKVMYERLTGEDIIERKVVVGKTSLRIGINVRCSQSKSKYLCELILGRDGQGFVAEEDLGIIYSRVSSNSGEYEAYPMGSTRITVGGLKGKAARKIYNYLKGDNVTTTDLSASYMDYMYDRVGDNVKCFKLKEKKSKKDFKCEFSFDENGALSIGASG